METKAVSRYVRIAPRKARIVVDLVRGKSVPQAREILAFCERAAAALSLGPVVLPKRARDGVTVAIAERRADALV